MAGVSKLNGRPTWYATFYVGGTICRRSTGVKIKQRGLTESQTKRLAMQTAQSMEAASRGVISVSKAVDAVRSAASTVGVEAAKIPSVREYLSKYELTGLIQHRKNQQRAFERFLSFLGAGADMRLDLVTYPMCRDFVRAELRRVRRGTVTNYKQALSCAFNLAYRDDIIPKNPFAFVNMGAEARAVIPERGSDTLKLDAFTHEEVMRLLDVLPEVWRDMVTISVCLAGQRLGDCACLRWDSVDFEAGFVRLATRKTGEELEIPLVEPLRGRLLELRGVRRRGEHYVLPSMAHAYMRCNGSLSTDFTALLRGLGVAELIESSGGAVDGRRRYSSKSFHSLRRFVVTELRDSGVSADLCRALVGHRSEEVERMYYRATRARKEEAMRRLGDSLGGGGSRPDGGEG